MSLLQPRLAKLLSAAAITALVVMLAFRFAVYRHMYIAPGDPYGISDIVEFLLGLGLMFVLGISVIAAIALAVRGPKDNRIAAGWLLGVCILVAVIVEPLHTLAAKWAP